MSGTYLTWLADELCSAGLDVVEYDGWQTRARSSGGYSSGRPWGVMWHHTASSTSPANDASYMCHGSSDRPIANLLIARDGAVWVLAAGATNTNGKGGPWAWSRGLVPVDSMNTHAVGIEIANDGVGEPYPRASVDAAFGASVAIARRLGLAPTDVCTHQRYAPDRKIDPADADAVQGPWRPSSSTSSGTWSLDDLLDEHQRRWTSTAPPTIRCEYRTGQDDDDMKMLLTQADGDGTIFCYSGTAICTMAGWSTIVAGGGALGLWDVDTVVQASRDEIQNVINQCWVGGPVPPGFQQPPARLP